MDSSVRCSFTVTGLWHFRLTRAKHFDTVKSVYFHGIPAVCRVISGRLVGVDDGNKGKLYDGGFGS